MTDLQDAGLIGGLQCAPLPAPIDPKALGSARLIPDGAVEAGSWQTFELIYTVGRYGIDDSGALRVCFRYAADHTKPQFTDPKAPGYTVIKASNNAVLECRFDPKGNVRPFDQTIYVKVVNGYMKEGDTITIVFGDTSGGSPGMRVQTFVEDTFEFRVLVDPIATYNFQSLPHVPTIPIVSGPPARYVLTMPTLRRAGEPFAIGLKAEDVWGNPSNRSDATFAFVSSLPVEGLPPIASIGRGNSFLRLEGLKAAEAGRLELAAVDENGDTVAGPQRMVVVESVELLPFWADFHAQSEETIGTGSAERYFAFCRDEAHLDVASHQGNDFQITQAFWDRLNAITAQTNVPGQFVTLPGYEWSGNTALGGDRNVFFTTEGRPMRRSSHALTPDRSDVGFDCTTAGELFGSLAAAKEDVICFAHCGGRYADISVAHDIRIETAVEVHSSWGTFEWLLNDALTLGYRVGVVCNSDGHKGRPGAEYPGASQFGAIGGLTCLLIPELSREAVVVGLRKRHHYGTTGGPNGRLHLLVEAALDARLCDRGPALGGHSTEDVSRLMMGDIAETDANSAEISIEVTAAVGVERIDIFNGLDKVASTRNYGSGDLGNRVRVLMEGAAYRGRFRQVNWNGTASVGGASIEEAQPINFFNPDRVLEQSGSDGLSWKLITTGNFGGFDAWLDDLSGAAISIKTPLIEAEADLGELGLEEKVWAAEGGPLPRLLRLLRLPDARLAPTMEVNRTVSLQGGRDNAIYVRVALEDGTLAWSSPIYLLKQD